jgi:hypothetical protein
MIIAELAKSGQPALTAKRPAIAAELPASSAEKAAAARALCRNATAS